MLLFCIPFRHLLQAKTTSDNSVAEGSLLLSAKLSQLGGPATVL